MEETSVLVDRLSHMLAQGLGLELGLGSQVRPFGSCDLSLLLKWVKDLSFKDLTWSRGRSGEGGVHGNI